MVSYSIYLRPSPSRLHPPTHPYEPTTAHCIPPSPDVHTPHSHTVSPLARAWVNAELRFSLVCMLYAAPLHPLLHSPLHSLVLSTPVSRSGAPLGAPRGAGETVNWRLATSISATRATHAMLAISTTSTMSSEEGWEGRRTRRGLPNRGGETREGARTMSWATTRMQSIAPPPPSPPTPPPAASSATVTRTGRAAGGGPRR